MGQLPAQPGQVLHSEVSLAEVLEMLATVWSNFHWTCRSPGAWLRKPKAMSE